MNIAILSDSHGARDYLIKCFQYCKQNNIFNIIHAGDFVFDDISDIFDDFININFFIAIGNCDVNIEEINKLKLRKNVIIDNELTFLLDNKKIFVSHKKKIIDNIDICIYGHTHIYFVDFNNKPIIINPGSLYDSRMFLVLNLNNYTLSKIFLK